MEVFHEVFWFLLAMAAVRKLIKGKTLGVDSTMLETNAAMKTIIRKDSGDDWMTRQSDIADAVRRLPERIQAILLERVNVRCARGDVVSNDRRYGHRLSGKIAVRDGNDVRNAPNDLRNASNDRRY